MIGMISLTFVPDLGDGEFFNFLQEFFLLVYLDLLLFITQQRSRIIKLYNYQLSIDLIKVPTMDSDFPTLHFLHFLHSPIFFSKKENL